jgi:HEAT repeat protein
VPLFQSRLTDKDPAIRKVAIEGLGRAGTAASVASLEMAANQDESEMVRAAMAFALLKKGHWQFLGRLVDFMDHERTALQVQVYFLELGPSVVAGILPRLQEPDESVRRHLAGVLGALGDQSTVTALTPLKQDPDRDVATAASRAIERIQMAQK